MKKKGGHSLTNIHTHTHIISANTHKRLKSMRNVKIFYNTEKGRKFSKFLSKKLFTCVYDFTCICVVAICMCMEAFSAAYAFSKISPPNIKFFSYVFVYLFSGVSNSVGFLCLPACLMSIKSAQKCSLHRALDASRHIPSSRRVLIKKKVEKKIFLCWIFFFYVDSQTETQHQQKQRPLTFFSTYIRCEGGRASVQKKIKKKQNSQIRRKKIRSSRT